MRFCALCGHPPRARHQRHCARCARLSGEASIVKCEQCGTESQGIHLVIIKPCPACQADTIHFRADNFARPTSSQLAELIVRQHRSNTARA